MEIFMKLKLIFSDDKEINVDLCYVENWLKIKIIECFIFFLSIMNVKDQPD